MQTGDRTRGNGSQELAAIEHRVPERFGHIITGLPGRTIDIVMRGIARVAICFVWSAMLPLGAAPITRPYTTESYDVGIQLDLAKQHLTGEVRIRLHSTVDTPISALELDAGSLRITSVLEGEDPLTFDRDHGRLFVGLTHAVRDDQPRTITIRYEAVAAPGLRFYPDQIYSLVTSDWMPCNDIPGQRATLHLTIAAPSDMKTAGSGQLTATRAGDGQRISEWQVDTPTDPSNFGFAVGSFSENSSDAEGVKLRVLGADAKILNPTAAALSYLDERTGKHYPGQTYTQVFIHGDAGRSMTGLTLLPESYGKALGKQPDDLWLLADMLARQWYGVGIVPRDWSDLWLSDGISAFAADAFLGQRLGKERYEREIERSRQIYNQLRAEGRDRSLSFIEWTTRQEADGQIPENKGVYFLYLVNQMVGDNAFWNGLRLYTSDVWSRGATSEDLQKAFNAVHTGKANSGEKSAAPGRRKNSTKPPKNAPKNLDNLFDVWVYGISDSNPR